MLYELTPVQQAKALHHFIQKEVANCKDKNFISKDVKEFDSFILEKVEKIFNSEGYNVKLKHDSDYQRGYVLLSAQFEICTIPGPKPPLSLEVAAYNWDGLDDDSTAKCLYDFLLPKIESSHSLGYETENIGQFNPNIRNKVSELLLSEKQWSVTESAIYGGQRWAEVVGYKLKIDKSPPAKAGSYDPDQILSSYRRSQEAANSLAMSRLQITPQPATSIPSSNPLARSIASKPTSTDPTSEAFLKSLCENALETLKTESIYSYSFSENIPKREQKIIENGLQTELGHGYKIGISNGKFDQENGFLMIEKIV